MSEAALSALVFLKPDRPDFKTAEREMQKWRKCEFGFQSSPATAVHGQDSPPSQLEKLFQDTLGKYGLPTTFALLEIAEGCQVEVETARSLRDRQTLESLMKNESTKEAWGHSLSEAASSWAVKVFKGLGFAHDDCHAKTVAEMALEIKYIDADEIINRAIKAANFYGRCKSLDKLVLGHAQKTLENPTCDLFTEERQVQAEVTRQFRERGILQGFIALSKAAECRNVDLTHLRRRFTSAVERVLRVGLREKTGKGWMASLPGLRSLTRDDRIAYLESVGFPNKDNGCILPIAELVAGLKDSLIPGLVKAAIKHGKCFVVGKTFDFDVMKEVQACTDITAENAKQKTQDILVTRGLTDALVYANKVDDCDVNAHMVQSLHDDLVKWLRVNPQLRTRSLHGIDTQIIEKLKLKGMSWSTKAYLVSNPSAENFATAAEDTAIASLNTSKVELNKRLKTARVEAVDIED